MSADAKVDTMAECLAAVWVDLMGELWVGLKVDAKAEEMAERWVYLLAERKVSMSAALMDGSMVASMVGIMAGQSGVKQVGDWAELRVGEKVAETAAPKAVRMDNSKAVWMGETLVDWMVGELVGN